MLDDHTTPPDARTLSERLKERMESRPDKWTLAWWKKQMDEITKAYLGVCHSINRCLMVEKGHGEKLKTCEADIKSVKEENELLQAAVAEMRGDITAIKDRQEGMAAWAAKIEKNGKQ